MTRIIQAPITIHVKDHWTIGAMQIEFCHKNMDVVIALSIDQVNELIEKLEKQKIGNAQPYKKTK